MNDEGLPWRHGAIAGTVAWTVGFAVMLVLLTLLVGPGNALANPFRAFVFATRFFLGAHLWPLLAGTAGGGVGLRPVLFTPIPGMLLFAAGYRVAAVSSVHWSREAYLTGATVGTGYAAMTVALLALLTVLSGSLSTLSAYIFIVGFTGGIMPLLAGGFGGIIAAR